MKRLIGATMLLAAAALSGKGMAYIPIIGRSYQQFDLGGIMHAHRNNQRAKNQKRIRGLGRK